MGGYHLFEQLIFDIDEDVDGPIYLYYEMTNYFQNHRRYYQSRSNYQKKGEVKMAHRYSHQHSSNFFTRSTEQNMGSSDVELDCNPLYKNGSLLLNPCGLIANSFFTGQSFFFNLAQGTQCIIESREPF